MPTKLHAAARALAAKSIRIFPCRPGTKFPAFKGAFYNSSCSQEQIDAWWDHDDYNIGLCPEQNGWAVIDVDKKGDGEATLVALEKEHGRLPVTLTVRTPSGGRHLYFRGSLPASQGASGLGPGLDTRGRGSFVLGPPSSLPTGDYTLDVNAPIAPLPTWTLQTLRRRETSPREAKADARIDSQAAIEQARTLLAKEPIPGPDGEGDDYVVFGRCKDIGVSQETLLQLCLDRGSYEADTDWLEFTIGNVWKYGQNEPASDYRDPAERLRQLLPDRTYGRLLAHPSGPVRELIAGLVERGRVAYMVGTGGTHKSRIAAHWGLAVHAGTAIYGREVQRSTFVHLSWENGIDEDARRGRSIAGKLGLDHETLGSAIYYDLCDDPRPLAVVGEGNVAQTTLWDEIAALLSGIEGHKFVVIDSLYNALHFTQQAKIDEASVKVCINWLDQQCRLYDFSGLMLQHPSARGRTEGHAGYSEAWNNAPRVRLNIAQIKDSDIYELKVVKRNNSQAGASLKLVWADGILDVKSETASATDRQQKLERACIELAILYAQQGHPIMKTKLQDALTRIRYTLSDSSIQVKHVQNALDGALGTELSYHHEQANRAVKAGYYAFPGPGGKGFD